MTDFTPKSLDNLEGWMPRIDSSQRCSRVWKDILSIQYLYLVMFNSFNDNLVLSIGNGNRISFWNDVWIGNSALRVEFPRMFSEIS